MSNGIESLIEAATAQPLVDAGLIGLLDDSQVPTRFTQAIGGPVHLKFAKDSFVLSQPEGKETIEVFKGELATWTASLRETDFEVAVASIYEQACYRRTYDCNPPFVTAITLYKHHTKIPAIAFALDTGGVFGLESSHYDGLRVFYDGHLKLFEAEYGNAVSLRKESVWKRDA